VLPAGRNDIGYLAIFLGIILLITGFKEAVQGGGQKPILYPEVLGLVDR
jgi:hypothetical protein